MRKSVRLCLLLAPGLVCVLVAGVVVSAATEENLVASFISSTMVLFIGTVYLLSCTTVYLMLDFRDVYVTRRRETALSVTIAPQDLQAPRDAAEQILLEGYDSPLVEKDERDRHQAFVLGEKQAYKACKRVYCDLLMAVEAIERTGREKQQDATTTLSLITEIMRGSWLAESNLGTSQEPVVGGSLDDAFLTGEKSGTKDAKKRYRELLSTLDGTVRENKNPHAALENTMYILRGSSLARF